jgi:two-component system nitrate/nitrite response regulator NarL
MTERGRPTGPSGGYRAGSACLTIPKSNGGWRVRGAEVAMEAVRTLVIDSSRLFREGLRHLLSGTQFEIALECNSIAEALAHVERQFKPDLVLCEYDPAEDWLDGLKALRELCGESRIVVLSTALSERSLAQTLDAGVAGYLLKNISLPGLTRSLELAMLGETVFPTQLATLLAEGKATSERPMFRSSVRPNGLSERESAILRCLVSGYPNKVIADQLQMTEASVKVHLKAVLRKIQASNRTQAAIWAINNGFQTDQQR